MSYLIQNYTHNFKGLDGCDSNCVIRIFKGVGRDEGMSVVICTQVVEDEGTSITNWAGRLATEISLKHDISPNRLIWIEHYPEEREGDLHVESEENYQRVTFEIVRGAFHDPEWHPLERSDVEAMIGTALQTVSVDLTKTVKTVVD